MLGLGLIVAGAALFVRYSMTRYMRFWLLRMVYEERSQTDRTVEAMNSGVAVARPLVLGRRPTADGVRGPRRSGHRCASGMGQLSAWRLAADDVHVLASTSTKPGCNGPRGDAANADRGRGRS